MQSINGCCWLCTAQCCVHLLAVSRWPSNHRGFACVFVFVCWGQERMKVIRSPSDGAFKHNLKNWNHETTVHDATVAIRSRYSCVAQPHARTHTRARYSIVILVKLLLWIRIYYLHWGALEIIPLFEDLKAARFNADVHSFYKGLDIFPPLGPLWFLSVFPLMCF